jgi:hypothetical protein
VCPEKELVAAIKDFVHAAGISKTEQLRRLEVVCQPVFENAATEITQDLRAETQLQDRQTRAFDMEDFENKGGFTTWLDTRSSTLRMMLRCVMQLSIAALDSKAVKTERRQTKLTAALFTATSAVYQAVGSIRGGWYSTPGVAIQQRIRALSGGSAGCQNLIYGLMLGCPSRSMMTSVEHAAVPSSPSEIASKLGNVLSESRDVVALLDNAGNYNTYAQYDRGEDRKGSGCDHMKRPPACHAAARLLTPLSALAAWLLMPACLLVLTLPLFSQPLHPITLCRYNRVCGLRALLELKEEEGQQVQSSERFSPAFFKHRKTCLKPGSVEYEQLVCKLGTDAGTAPRPRVRALLLQLLQRELDEAIPRCRRDEEEDIVTDDTDFQVANMPTQQLLTKFCKRCKEKGVTQMYSSRTMFCESCDDPLVTAEPDTQPASLQSMMPSHFAKDQGPKFFQHARGVTHVRQELVNGTQASRVLRAPTAERSPGFAGFAASSWLTPGVDAEARGTLFVTHVIDPMNVNPSSYAAMKKYMEELKIQLGLDDEDRPRSWVTCVSDLAIIDKMRKLQRDNPEKYGSLLLVHGKLHEMMATITWAVTGSEYARHAGFVNRQQLVLKQHWKHHLGTAHALNELRATIQLVVTEYICDDSAVDGSQFGIEGKPLKTAKGALAWILDLAKSDSTFEIVLTHVLYVHAASLFPPFVMLFQTKAAGVVTTAHMPIFLIISSLLRPDLSNVSQVPRRGPAAAAGWHS